MSGDFYTIVLFLWSSPEQFISSWPLEQSLIPSHFCKRKIQNPSAHGNSQPGILRVEATRALGSAVASTVIFLSALNVEGCGMGTSPDTKHAKSAHQHSFSTKDE